MATLGYLLTPDRRQVLLVHRDRRPDDLHLGYCNGLGGKLEPGEDAAAGMAREIREESGLDCHELELAGTISWPGFGRAGENWFAFVFRVTGWSGQPYRECPEGTLAWHPVADLLTGRVPVRPSDANFLPLVFAEPPRLFHGVQPFSGGVPQSWSHTLTG